MDQIKCGAAKVKITPPAELLAGLYGLMGSHYSAVIDDLHVRVLAVSAGNSASLFVSWELDKAPNPETLVPELSKRTGVPEDNILFFGVHTHTAPVHSARPYDGPNAKAKQTPERQAATNKYEEILAGALFEAADKAMSSLQPARIGWGLGESYVGENRVQDYYVKQKDGGVKKTVNIGSNPKGNCDRTLFVLKAESLDGKPIAFFVNHAVHCCIMILNNYDGNMGVGISADLAGQVSSLIEEKYPGSVALWSSAAAGDVNPIMMNQYNYADPITGEHREYKKYKSADPAKLMLFTLSRRQFAEAESVIRDIKCETTQADVKGGTEFASVPANDGTGNPSSDEVYQVRLRAVKIGDVEFCGASGELFTSLGAQIKKAGTAAYTVVINHECSLLVNSGYILDDDALERTLQPDGSHDGLPGTRNYKLLPGYIGPALYDAAGRLFARL